MAQNRSTAVMQRRRPTPPDALEYFPTQPWAVRALCEFLASIGEPLAKLGCWEPTCGEGFMADALAEYFGRVEATDVWRYSDDHAICDFLAAPAGRRADWVVINPPFKPALRFIEAGLQHCRRGVAAVMRISALEGGERHDELFAVHPPAWVLVYSERVVMLEGRLIEDGKPDPFNLDEQGQPKKASSATSYCCIVWIPGEHETRLRLTGKVRDRLKRAGDYPAYAEQWAKIAGEAPLLEGLE